MEKMEKPTPLDQLVTAVLSSSKYSQVDPGMIRRIGANELAKNRNLKEATKATRNLLHQVGSVYFTRSIDYTQWAASLQAVPGDISSPLLRDLCRSIMLHHASTRERLPYLQAFYDSIFVNLGKINSVLDLACGLNPLALPWMPLSQDCVYYACDIYQDLIQFLNIYLSHINNRGTASVVDLSHEIPSTEVDLALLLKIIPGLEQLEKNIATRLLQSIHAQHLLISFPARSLGGHRKGMVKHYETYFRELISPYDWTYQRFIFPGELVFLVSKSP